jgi:hypothetical protein
VIKPGIRANRDISFSVENIEQNGARLDAVNSLTNALGGEFYKTFVIKRANDDGPYTPPAIDSSASVVFKNGSVPAEEAIKTVTGVDDATARFYSSIDDNVTFTATKMPAYEAANQISRQTQTRWRAIYVIVPRNSLSRVHSRVNNIGGASPGARGSETPLLSFDEEQKPQENKQADNNSQGSNQANKSIAQNSPAASNPYINNTNPYAYGANPYGYGGYPYGYNPYAYGYNPYAYGANPYSNGNDTNGYAANPYSYYYNNPNGYASNPYMYGFGYNPYGYGTNPYANSGSPYAYQSPGLTIIGGSPYGNQNSFIYIGPGAGANGNQGGNGSPYYNNGLAFLPQYGYNNAPNNYGYPGN